MENIWQERIELMLAEPARSYHGYLRSVLKFIEGNPVHYPTEPQKTLLRRFWEAHQKRLTASVIGE